MAYILFYILVYVLLRQEAKSIAPNMRIRQLLAVLFVLFVGLRGANVGQDTAVYYQHYYYFGQWGCNFVEPGFDWINRFCYHQGWESWTMFVICSALTVFPVYKMMNKLSREEYTIVAMFFYCTTFATIANGMRQAVVCGVFFYLMSLFFNKNTYSKKELAIYFSCMFLSTLMHVSILLLLPVLFLTKVPANKNFYLIAYVLSFAFLFIDASVFLPDISIGNRDYGRYLENLHVKQASGLGFFGVTSLKILILYCMCKYNAFSKYRMLSHFVMFYLILGNLGFNLPIISRVSMYFTWFTYIMIAKLYCEGKQTGKVVPYTVNIWTIIFACYFLLQMNTIFTTRNHLTPYTTYWQVNDYMNYIWVEQ